MLTTPAVKARNLEPLPGYRLLAPLGKGGFGEVWKCLAPDGVVKAIKFVQSTADSIAPGADAAALERKAVEHVQSIRHPFLLGIERVESTGGELVIVMELADRNLQETLDHYRCQGRPGIPRSELLDYMIQAAQALDVLNQQHHLQHLDIKPHNLFLVDRQVKVADFGLLGHLADPASRHAQGHLHALSPRYGAPETFAGHFTRFSDQYSLAVTYHELLTGTLPFDGRNMRQLTLQHLNEEPDLTRLSPGDRAVLACALAKDPGQRFPSCTAFVRALESAAPPVLTEQLSDLLDSIRGAALIEGTIAQRGNLVPGLPLEHRCFTRLPPELLTARLDIFCQESNARCLSADTSRMVLQIRLEGSFWQRCLGLGPTLEIGISLCGPRNADGLTRIDVSLWPLNCGKERATNLLQGMGRKLIDRLREHFEVLPDRRRQERYPYDTVIKVYTLSGNGARGKPITARTRDLSLSGIGLYLPNRPATTAVCLELGLGDRADEPVFMPGHITYCDQEQDGFFTAGVRFLGQNEG